MKKILLLITMVMAGQIVLAQQGEIIYTDFEPNITAHYCGTVQDPYIGDHLYFDIDQDGVNETHFFPYRGPLLTIHAVMQVLTSEGWDCCLQYFPNEDHIYPWLDYSDTLHFGDPIQNGVNWTGGWQYLRPYGNTSPKYDEIHLYVGIRHQVDEGYCYGWLESSINISKDGYDLDVIVFRMAYCTVPNYPLCLGQTSFEWSLEETDYSPIRIFPNPTGSNVTIIGKDLQLIELYNLAGQRLMIRCASGMQNMLDLEELTPGFYIVNVTDKNGRKSVQKLVKK